MTESDFQRLATLGYNRIPVTLETFADLDTPLSIYLKLANRPHSYLLESVIGGERSPRYFIIGLPAREGRRGLRRPDSRVPAHKRRGGPQDPRQNAFGPP